MEAEPFLRFIAIVITLVIVWLLHSNLLSSMGGWRALARSYPSPENFHGEQIYGQGARFWRRRIFAIWHPNRLTIGANESGVNFIMTGMFRPGHASFFVPYGDLAGKEVSLLLMHSVRLVAAKEPDVTIMIDKKAAVWIEGNSNGNWSFARKSSA